MNALELFHQGGFIMYPLLIFSVLMWIVTLHKIFYLTNFRKQSKKFQEEATKMIINRKFSEMEWLYKSCPEVIAKAHFAVFDPSKTQDEWDARLHRRIVETNQDLKKNLWILGTIGSSAPFVGLFGTVWGIMGSFKAIGSSGKSGFAVVSVSISEALIATAAGILVAVLAVIFYNYLQVKISETATEFKNALGDMADQFNAVK